MNKQNIDVIKERLKEIRDILDLPMDAQLNEFHFKLWRCRKDILHAIVLNQECDINE